MKNCEPLVFGPGVRHRDRAERVLALHRLVVELVAGAAGAACPRGQPPWITKSGTTRWNVRPS